MSVQPTRAYRVEAPWSPEEVANLNRFQASGLWHEFTCAKDHAGERRLIAEPDGWRCPTCGNRQTWAHPFMSEFTAEIEALTRRTLDTLTGRQR